VSFGTVFPPNPCRGHFLWDGSALWIWDGVGWDKIGPASPGTAGIPEAPIDGNLYGRENAAWVVVSQSTGAITKITTVFYLASQVITVPPGATQAQVVMWGATGGSGGVNNTATSGTGAGGYLEKYLTGLVPGNTLSYMQGIGGTAGAAGGAGGNATVTTLSSGSQAIGTLTCNGSNGSPAGASGTGAQIPGTPGGSATGGDFNMTGQAGGSMWQAGTNGVVPPGGSTFYSLGANGLDLATASPGNPGNPGGLRITWIETAS
jgi:hypothetical protein